MPRLATMLLLSISGLAGCVNPAPENYVENPYYSLCCQQGHCPENVDEVMCAHGFDCVGCGGSFGGNDIAIRGTPEVRFNARELVLRFVKERGWKVGWMADCIILKPEWDQMGWERGPWVRLASVEHRITHTALVIDRLHKEGIRTRFEFGETTDFVFVHGEHADPGRLILRAAPLPGVLVH